MKETNERTNESMNEQTKERKKERNNRPARAIRRSDTRAPCARRPSCVGRRRDDVRAPGACVWCVDQIPRVVWRRRELSGGEETENRETHSQGATTSETGHAAPPATTRSAGSRSTARKSERVPFASAAPRWSKHARRLAPRSRRRPRVAPDRGAPREALTSRCPCSPCARARGRGRTRPPAPRTEHTAHRRGWFLLSRPAR
jgi:hypothetical protein